MCTVPATQWWWLPLHIYGMIIHAQWTFQEPYLWLWNSACMLICACSGAQNKHLLLCCVCFERCSFTQGGGSMQILLLLKTSLECTQHTKKSCFSKFSISVYIASLLGEQLYSTRYILHAVQQNTTGQFGNLFHTWKHGEKIGKRVLFRQHY